MAVADANRLACRHPGVAISLAALVLASSINAYAQSAGADESGEIEEIVVTGSRIARRDFVSPSPISTIDRARIEASPQATLEELLNRMPQVLPDFGRASNNPGDGTARLNLRGLGPGRALVMLNFRRLAPSGVGSAVDLNTIPQVLIERVEIITGGASAVYGSDALAGVVNFITRDDFRGFSLEAGYNVTGEGDAESYDVNLAFGTDFVSGSGNFVAYAGFYERSAVFWSARALTSRPLFEDTDIGTIEPGGSIVSPEGIIRFPEVPFPTGDPFVTFNPDGTPRQWVYPDDLYNYAPANYLQLPHKRYSAGIFANYEMPNGFEWYIETGVAQNEASRRFAPVPAFGAFLVNTGNPTLTPEARQLFEEYYQIEPGLADVFLLRRMNEVGDRQSDSDRNYWRTVVGLRGELGNGWDMDAWITYTESDETELLLNDASRSRLAQSLLVDPVTGACLDPSGGCVPADIFGPGRISADAAEFLHVPTLTNTTRRVQKLASIFVRGSPIETWAGPLDIAAGLEWRSDAGRFRADAALLTGDTLGYAGDAAVDGTEEVTEIYAEAIVPLLRGAAGDQYLELEVGARYSKYDNSGSIKTYKLGGMWQPLDSIRLRIMEQRSVRAPNNLELFQEQYVENFPFILSSQDDPCSASADPVARGNAERCILQGLPPDQIGVFEAAPFFPTQFVYGGNPDLRPEEAATRTFGVVLTPTAMPNWNFSVDFYEIELEGAIGEISSADICFDPVNTGNLFCENLRRGPTGDVVEIIDLFNNLGLVSTRGIDSQAQYVADLPAGMSLLPGGAQFGINLVWSHTLEELHQENQVAQVIRCDGYFGSPCGTYDGTSPTNRLNTTLTYTSGRMAVQLNSYWIEGTDSFRGIEWQIFGDEEPVLAIPSIGSRHYLNLNIDYDFSDTFSASLGIANLLDTGAPLLADNTSNANTDTSLYDVFGLAFHVSFKMRFVD